MHVRRLTLAGICALVALLTTAACSLNQPSRFRSPFLPPAPTAPIPPHFDHPPEINPFVNQMPPYLLTSLQLTDRASRADLSIQRANQAFQRGKQAYQSNDIPTARREFDSAIDLLLDAFDQDPSNRQELDNKLDDMTDAIHRFDLAGMGASAIVDNGKFEKAPLEDILDMTFPVDPKLKDKVREQVAATVSQLPLTVNDTVLGYINYFMNHGHKTIVNAIQRSGRYRPMIQRVLDEEGVPQELIHLAQAESGFIPRAMSRKAAGGMWQFVKFRGNQYGLHQTPLTDDRMDPEMATRAAAHHLHDLYSEFGDWYLAIAAYNCGPVVVEGAVARTGFADFWELRSRGVLPAETTNYVPIILAMTIMEKNAAEYGLDSIQMDPPLDYDSVELSAKTSFALVSDITETPLSELAALNPAVLRSAAPAGYSLRVPKGSGIPLMAALQLVPPDRRDAWRMHLVGDSETLADIAKRYAVTPSSIASTNHLASPQAEAGDRLLIPAVLRPEAPAKRPPAQTAAHRKPARSKTTPAKTKTAAKPRAKSPVIVARSRAQ